MKRTQYHKLIKPKFSFHTMSLDVIDLLLAPAVNLNYILLAVKVLKKSIDIKAIRHTGALTTFKFIFNNVIFKN